MINLKKFLSGELVYTAVGNFFERMHEPRFRRKASEGGFSAEFEKVLAEMKSGAAPNPSFFAFKIARGHHRQVASK